MGDTNAHVKTDRQRKEDIIGHLSYRNKDGEGGLSIDICRRNGLIVENRWFRKNNTQKIDMVQRKDSSFSSGEGET